MLSFLRTGGAIAAASVAVSDCGADTASRSESVVKDDIPAATAATAPSAITTDPAATPVIPFKPDHGIVWGAEDSNLGSDDISADWIQSGATATVTVELGKLEKADLNTVPSTFSPYLTACDFDRELDAVIPMRIKVSNTSKVPLNVTVNGYIQHPAAYSAPGMTIDAGTQFGDGPACQSGGGINSTNYNWTEDVALAGTSDHDWLLVVHNYYYGERQIARW